MKLLSVNKVNASTTAATAAAASSTAAAEGGATPQVADTMPKEVDVLITSTSTDQDLALANSIQSK